MKRSLFFADLELDEAAFNGQFSKHLVWSDLKSRLAGTFAVETGTYLGGTTAFLSRFFPRVLTIELEATYQQEAKLNVGDAPGIEFVLGDSAGYLREHLPRWVAEGDVPEFFYLDAHWEAVCPLADEVELISRSCPDAIIMIDDMEIPDDEGYGFDRYEAVVLDRDYLAEVVKDFGLTCFVPSLASSRDCMARIMIKPRGTWLLAQTLSTVEKLRGCASLRPVEIEYQADAARRNLKQARASLHDRIAQTGRLKAEIRNLEQEVKNRTAELIETRETLQRRTRDLESIVPELNARTQELVEARNHLMERTKTAETFATHLEARTAELVEARALLAERTETAEAFAAHLEACTAELVATRETLVERTYRLENLSIEPEAVEDRTEHHALLVEGDKHPDDGFEEPDTSIPMKPTAGPTPSG